MTRLQEPSIAPMPPAEPPIGGTAVYSRRGVITWAVVGSGLLVSSGVVRAVQDRRFAVEMGYLEDCPFPLKMLPKEFEGWRLLGGSDLSLDPMTTKITGATEHLLRTYVDELTGVNIQVLILFGPAEPVLPHTPQICYPACGFRATEDPATRLVPGPENRGYLFQTGVYEKPGGRTKHREVAYHSFRLEGEWSPFVAMGRKFPRKNPGIFKIQIQRRVVDGERRGNDDPIEQFLSRLMPEVDRRIAEGRASKAPASVVGPAASRVGSGDPGPA